ncbi:hypothetical protein PS934_04058 [Pseudomonas fluorescens]|nr:hypothetical protein PS934_04058 [Pseudomonas fluorescens]
MSEKQGAYRMGNVLFISKVPFFSTYTPAPPYHPGSDSKRCTIRYLPSLSTPQK